MHTFAWFKFLLWSYGLFKIPLIGYLRPKLILLNDQEIVLKIRLNRRSKNHLNSMYFGALAVGADLAGGFHGLYYANQHRYKISLAFKSFEAQFLKRAEADVYFIGKMGQVVNEMLLESKQTGQRVNKPIQINAYTHYPENSEEVAQFILELSVKVSGLR